MTRRDSTIPASGRPCADRGGRRQDSFELEVPVAKNPYSPGAGVRPAALVGRVVELRDWTLALRRLEKVRPARSVVLHGLGGEGKTVLLREFHRRAEDRDWLTVIVEATTSTSLRDSLARALDPVVRDLARPGAGEKLAKALTTFKAFSVKVDIASAWSFRRDFTSGRGRGDSGQLETDLGELIRDLAEAAEEQRRGLAILIDEAQELTRDEMRALCAICRQGEKFAWPFLVALAGLPSLPAQLSKADISAQHLFSYQAVTALKDDAALQALTRPAAIEGLSWAEDALMHVLNQAHGHPYLLQMYGHATCEAATGPTLTFDDARVGVVAGQAQLDSGVYPACWEQATPGQRAYLVAMARDGAVATKSTEIAARLGKSRTAVGTLRDSLIKMRLIYAPQHGYVAYTIPGMADCLARQSRP